MRYGTIAKLKILPGKIDEFLAVADTAPNGIVFEHIYQLDSGNDEYMLAVGFESKEAYQANAASPEMHQLFLQYRALLAADPEWHDGVILQSRP